ncbi:hypothetical protein EDC04DRAFT_2570559, partial [Pisolithus marmoratus]
GIGPDILQDVDDKFLSDMGISASDVIHLKKGSTTWWNGPDAKHKRSNMSASASAPETQGPLPRNKSHMTSTITVGVAVISAALPSYYKGTTHVKPLPHAFSQIFQLL